MLPKVSITPAATKFISRMVRLSGLSQSGGLRLVVGTGGCSGYTSEFSAETSARPEEITLELDGLRLYLPPGSCELLDGVTIDFVETATQSGLSFINPKQPACACGSADVAPKPAVTRIEISAIGGRRPASPMLVR